MVTLATGKSKIYVERSCVDRRRGLLCANFLLGIFVKRSRGLHLRVGEGALSGYLLDASQLLHSADAYNTLIA